LKPVEDVPGTEPEVQPEAPVIIEDSSDKPEDQTSEP
jgi:hypothetical protein